MPDDPKPPAPGLSGNAFLWLAVVGAVTAYVSHPVSLENLRPPIAEFRNLQASNAQDIDARLWQDPFESVLKSVGDYYGWTRADGIGIGPGQPLLTKVAHAEYCGGPVENQDPHYCSPLEEADKATNAVGIMVPGGSYSEDAEFRRRVRYAVLSGLSVQGYVPVDSQHIGVFIPLTLNYLRDEATDPADWQGPKFVPYEIVRKRSSGSGSAPGNRLALFWLDEDALSHQPLNQLARLFCQIKPVSTDAGDFQVKIIGPQELDTLLAMLNNLSKAPKPPDGMLNGEPNSSAERCDFALVATPGTGKSVPALAPHMFDRFEIYDYGATADPAALCREFATDCDPAQDWVERQFSRKGINFLRTIASDNALAQSINTELQRRGINSDAAAHIALISEWDTYYGQSLRTAFEAYLIPGGGPSKPGGGSRQTLDKAELDRRTAKYIHRFSYLRGLDGQTAASVSAKKPHGSGNSDTSAMTAAVQAEAASGDGIDQGKTSDPGRMTLSDAAEGQGQSDYLLRLADELRDRDNDLRRVEGQGLRAIGVLGSDVYDKLLVVQALRVALPQAIFFTTDLDARLIHPGQGVWTRNLLVASSFGLSLRRDLQRDIPPFRSSYQTAAFLATLVAAGPRSFDLASGSIGKASGTLSKRLSAAQIFEIGRTRAIHLYDGKSPASQQADGPGCGASAQPVDISACGRLQSDMTAAAPPRVMLALELTLLESVLVSALLLLLLWLYFGGQWLHKRASITSTVVTFVIIFIMVCGLQRWSSSLGMALSDNGNGELTAPLESVSLWPSTGLKLISILLSVALIIHIGRVSAANINDIAENLGMTDIRNQIDAERPTRSRLGFRKRFKEAFPLRIRDADDIAAAADGMRRSSSDALVKAYWIRYIDYGRGRAQFFRVSTIVAVGMILEVALYGVFGTEVPYRGWVARDLYFGVTAVDSLATAALVFYVADATLFFLALRQRVISRPRQASVSGRLRLGWAGQEHVRSQAGNGAAGRLHAFH